MVVVEIITNELNKKKNLILKKQKSFFHVKMNQTINSSADFFYDNCDM